VEFLNAAKHLNPSGGNTVNFAPGKKLAVLLVVVALVAWPLAALAADEGADVYKSKCAMCHGPDGKGKMAGTKDLSSGEIQKMSDADLTAAITNGKPPKMPAYKGKLTDAQIKAVVGYLRTLKK
jgi:mono/diheme cytochrome c family protein